MYYSSNKEKIKESKKKVSFQDLPVDINDPVDTVTKSIVTDNDAAPITNETIEPTHISVNYNVHPDDTDKG